ncbi:hypothetical protein C8J56DRAFT_1054252 [Mycena floridula]|nr:hypothetical protein C8J56DRAFT_1054252 [Mycena floridula]
MDDWDKDLELSLPNELEAENGLSLTDGQADVDMFLGGGDFTSPAKPIHQGIPFRVARRQREVDRHSLPMDYSIAQGNHLQDLSFEFGEMDTGTTDQTPTPARKVIAVEKEVYDNYEVYQEAVFSGVAGFHQIGQDMFVIREWDTARRQVMTRWLHMTCRTQGNSVLFGCLCCCCQTWETDCVHKLFFKEYKDEKFGFSGNYVWPDIGNKAVMLLREVVNKGQTINTFSVGLRGEQRRVIVTHIGGDDGSGSWLCQKGCGRRVCCGHVQSAQDALQKLVNMDPDAEDQQTNEEAANAILDVMTMSTDECISQREIAPPEWASLPTDKVIYERLSFGQPILDLVPLDDHGSCICREGKWDCSLETIQRKAVVYGLYEAKEVMIELQKCRVCPALR